MAKYIAPEEEWLRLLVLELTPVLSLMRDNDLPTSKGSPMLFAAGQAASCTASDLTLSSGFVEHTSSWRFVPRPNFLLMPGR